MAGALGSIGAGDALTAMAVVAAAFLACDACRPARLPIAFNFRMWLAYATWLAATDGAGAVVCEGGAGDALTTIPVAVAVTAEAVFACGICRPVRLPLAFSLCIWLAYATWLAATDGTGAVVCVAPEAGARAEAAAGTAAEAGVGANAESPTSMSVGCFDDGRQGGARRSREGGLHYYPEPTFVKYQTRFDGI